MKTTIEEYLEKVTAFDEGYKSKKKSKKTKIKKKKKKLMNLM